MSEPGYAIHFADAGNSPGPKSWGPDARVWWDDEGHVLRIEAWRDAATRLYEAVREHGVSDPAALVVALRHFQTPEETEA